MPMWMSTWRPEADLRPYAWPVGKATVTFPSQGATTAPAQGEMAMPGPRAPPAKASSLTSLRGTLVPSMGEVRVRSALASSLNSTAGATAAGAAAAGAGAAADSAAEAPAADAEAGAVAAESAPAAPSAMSALPRVEA